MPISFNTASGKYCCNYEKNLPRIQTAFDLVSIPQAVSTVATFETGREGEYVSFFVSIPQAVSTVATLP